MGIDDGDSIFYPRERYWCECGLELHEAPSDNTSARSGRLECDGCHAVYYLMYDMRAGHCVLARRVDTYPQSACVNGINEIAPCDLKHLREWVSRCIYADGI